MKTAGVDKKGAADMRANMSDGIEKNDVSHVGIEWLNCQTLPHLKNEEERGKAGLTDHVVSTKKIFKVAPGDPARAASM